MRYQQDINRTGILPALYISGAPTSAKGAWSPNHGREGGGPSHGEAVFPVGHRPWPCGALTSHGERGRGLHFPHAVLGDAGVGPLVRARGFLDAQRVVVLDVIPVSQQKNENPFCGQHKWTKKLSPGKRQSGSISEPALEDKVLSSIR